MKVHLVDGTYELFRHFYAVPSAKNRDGEEIAAVRGVMYSLRRLVGVPPVSIPDYLALMGDASDGFPGLQGWGPKSAAAVLARFGHIADIPDDCRAWNLNVARAKSLAVTLSRDRKLAQLFRQLATLRTDVPVFASVDELEWHGPTEALPRLRRRLAVDDLS